MKKQTNLQACSSNKIRYETQEEARKNLNKIITRPGRKECSHYYCELCNGHHISSQNRAHSAKNTKADKVSTKIILPPPKPLAARDVANFYFQYSYENDKRRKNAKNYSL